MTLTPGARLGPYEILASLGAGGMGEVYRARDLRLGRTVAIKILPQHVTDNPTRRQRFEREARAASRLSHPHICALYDIGEQDQIHFIVMEYLEGETLGERVRRGSLPIGQVLRHAIEVADALDHAHRLGIVHRDLKPANIMLTRGGAKLLDFGVARLTASEAGDVTSHTAQVTETQSLTEEGTILGTLQYMSPEQLEGKETDARTDIFALGTVVYEMATARQAFEGASRASLIAAVLEHDPPPLSTVRSQSGSHAGSEGLVPPTLDHVVSRCLAKDPDERWQTAADVRQELKWIAEGGSQTGGTVAGAAHRIWTGRRLAWVAAVGLAMTTAGYLAARPELIGVRQLAEPTFRQLTFRRGNITQARFAPDGQTILYSAAWDGGPVQLYETTSRGTGSRSTGPSLAGLESVSSSGELALLLGCRLNYGLCVGTLARMPLTGGAPREVLEDVVSADWTPDGRSLAVIQAQTEYRVEFDGKTLHRTTGRLSYLRFAPQGDRLAFMEYQGLQDEIGVIKVVDLAGHVSTVSTGWKTIRGLQWSPAGDEIWFTGSRNRKACSLYAVSLSGRLRLILHTPGDPTLTDISRDGRVLLVYGPVRARMIWSGAGQERELSWLDWTTMADLSADGSTVLFHEWGEGVGGSPAVYMRRVDGPDAVLLGDGKALSLSPDGRWALALVEKDRPQLMLLPTGTGESRGLPTEGVTDVYWAKWFPDSRRVLLVVSDTEGVQSYIQDVDTGRLEKVADPGTLGVLVSPDGQRILVLDPLDKSYYLWPLGSEEPAPVTGLQPDDRPFQWSPDGRFLYLRGREEDVVRVYRYTLATGRRELWRELRPRDPTGVFGVATGRSEVAMTPDGSAVFTYWVTMNDLVLVEGVR